MLLHRDEVHGVFDAADVQRLVDACAVLQRAALREERGPQFLHHLCRVGFSYATTSARRVRDDVRRGRARGVRRVLLLQALRRRAGRGDVRRRARERSQPARCMRCWLCGAAGGRPCAAVRRAARTCAVRIVSFVSRSCGAVRSATARDVARASGSGRRAARSVRELSHTLLLLSVYGKAAGVREPCGVSSRPIRVSEHDVPGMPVRGGGRRVRRRRGRRLARQAQQRG